VSPRGRGKVARPHVRAQTKPRPRATPTGARPTQDKPAEGSRLAVRMVDEPAPYAEVTVHEPVTEESIERLFEHARIELLHQKPRRVLIDMSGVLMALSISDLNGLTKLIAASYAGIVTRLAIVLRPVDLPSEKFFEPSMSNRGLPTYVSQNRNDAIDWLTANLLPPR